MITATRQVRLPQETGAPTPLPFAEADPNVDYLRLYTDVNRDQLHIEADGTVKINVPTQLPDGRRAIVRVPAQPGIVIHNTPDGVTGLDEAGYQGLVGTVRSIDSDGKRGGFYSLNDKNPPLLVQERRKLVESRVTAGIAETPKKPSALVRLWRKLGELASGSMNRGAASESQNETVNRTSTIGAAALLPQRTPATQPDVAFTPAGATTPNVTTPAPKPLVRRVPPSERTPQQPEKDIPPIPQTAQARVQPITPGSKHTQLPKADGAAKPLQDVGNLLGLKEDLVKPIHLLGRHGLGAAIAATLQTYRQRIEASNGTDALSAQHYIALVELSGMYDMPLRQPAPQDKSQDR